MQISAIVWILISVALAILEAATMSLVSIWFCAGAVAAAVVSNFTQSVIWQITAFVVVSALLLLFTRPLLKKFIITNATPTNADRIIGSAGIVSVDIDPVKNVGQVEVNGQVWSAKSTSVIPKGTKVKVNAIEGVKAVVEVLDN